MIRLTYERVTALLMSIGALLVVLGVVAGLRRWGLTTCKVTNKAYNITSFDGVSGACIPTPNYVLSYEVTYSVSSVVYVRHACYGSTPCFRANEIDGTECVKCLHGVSCPNEISTSLDAYNAINLGATQWTCYYDHVNSREETPYYASNPFGYTFDMRYLGLLVPGFVLILAPCVVMLLYQRDDSSSGPGAEDGTLLGPLYRCPCLPKSASTPSSKIHDTSALASSASAAANGGYARLPGSNAKRPDFKSPDLGRAANSQNSLGQDQPQSYASGPLASYN